MSKKLETVKILAVKAYLQGEGTTHSQAVRLGVSEPTFREWLTKYKTFSERGLRASTKQMQYTSEIKKAAVMAHLDSQTGFLSVLYGQKSFRLRQYISSPIYKSYCDLRDTPFPRFLLRCDYSDV